MEFDAESLFTYRNTGNKIYTTDIHAESCEPVECQDSDLDILSFGDMKIEVEEKEIPVSTFILCKESPVFRKMLTSDFKEKNENKIKVTDCSYADILVFVKVIHQLTKVNTDNVFTVLPIVHKYMCQVYLDQCITLLTDMAKSHNLPTGQINNTGYAINCDMLDLILKILIHAEKYKLSNVTITSIQRLEYAKISDIKKSQYFLSLEHQTYTAILESNLSKLEQTSSKYTIPIQYRRTSMRMN
jgi:hypothetical protein